MTEFPSDEPAVHPTGFPAESEPDARPDPETEPGGGEPDFDSEPDRTATPDSDAHFFPNNNPTPSEDPAPSTDATDVAEETRSSAAPADEWPVADVVADPEAPDDGLRAESASDQWSPDAIADRGDEAVRDEAQQQDEADVAAPADAVDTAASTADRAVEGDGAQWSGDEVSGLVAVAEAGEAFEANEADGPHEAEDAHEADGVVARGIGEGHEVDGVRTRGAGGAEERAEVGARVTDGGEWERGHPLVEETMERLEDLQGRPVSEHGEVYADLQERLQAALAEAERPDAHERV